MLSRARRLQPALRRLIRAGAAPSPAHPPPTPHSLTPQIPKPFPLLRRHFSSPPPPPPTASPPPAVVSSSLPAVSANEKCPVPGTTLGVIRVDGVLGAQAKLFDTPGLLHGHQLTSRLTLEEQKLVHVRKEMRPRTYRLKAGQSIHMGGLARLDIEDLTVGSIYVTVWASALLPLHMGKTENAASMMKDHFGLQLQPPIGQKRVNELGKWVRKKLKVSGDNWDKNTMDIAISGLGWYGIGLKGEAVLGLWTYDGVDVVPRSSLVHERASIFEEAGFSVSKIVSQADSMTNKLKGSKKTSKKKESKSSSCPSAAPEPSEPAAVMDA